MARKTKVPEPTEEDIVNDQVAEFLGEKPEEEPVAEETPQEETPVKEAQKQPVVQEPQTAPVDYEKMKEEVSKEAADRIVKALSGSSEQQLSEATDQKSPWEKEGRNPKDYNEIAEWVADLADKRAQARQKEQETEAAKLRQQEDDNKKQWNVWWNRQLESMRNDGRLPKISNPDDPEDPGNKAEQELFEVGLRNKEYNLELAYYKFYNKSKQPPGADAPVSAGKKPVDTEDNENYTYEEIHNSRSTHELLGIEE